MLKDPPRFVTNIGAWDYVLARMAAKQEEDGKIRLDAYGNPLNYAGAIAYYKNAVRKYPAFRTDNLTTKPIHVEQNSPGDIEWVFENYPVGAMFWFDDVLCETVPYGKSGAAVYPNATGELYIRGKILDVDPEGKHRKWPIGKINGFPPHRRTARSWKEQNDDESGSKRVCEPQLLLSLVWPLVHEQLSLEGVQGPPARLRRF